MYRPLLTGALGIALACHVHAAGASEAPEGGSGMHSASICNVTAFGAMGDGVADDTPAFQEALDAAAAAGGVTVHAPAGTYRVILAVDGRPYSGTIAIREDPLIK